MVNLTSKLKKKNRYRKIPKKNNNKNDSINTYNNNENLTFTYLKCEIKHIVHTHDKKTTTPTTAKRNDNTATKTTIVITVV